jgi:hypothetical protein
MHLRTETALLLSLPLSVVLGLSACGDDGPVAEEETAGSETATETAGDGDGDTTPGDGDGDTTPGDGDGDTNTGDGDGDTDECPIGSEGCPCTGGGACDAGLMCDAGVCVPAAGDGDGDNGDGDGDNGDGDGDNGDGDGDPGSACVGDEEIAIEAEDADEIFGWDPVMSMLGEDIVLDWDDTVPDAYVQWNLDIPCDGDWHIWVRAVNLQGFDSFFVQVDGGPMPVPIFEIECTGDPQQQAEYVWNELNLRDPMAMACEYVEDPWVQTWTAGPHTFTLGYRESYAISKIWLTTSDQPPP